MFFVAPSTHRPAEILLTRMWLLQRLSARMNLLWVVPLIHRLSMYFLRLLLIRGSPRYQWFVLSFGCGIFHNTSIRMSLRWGEKARNCHGAGLSFQCHHNLTFMCFTLLFGTRLSRSDVTIIWRGTLYYCSYLWVKQDLRFLLTRSGVPSRCTRNVQL